MSTVTPVSFLAPPPGLEPLTEFALEDVDGAIGLYSLTGTDVSAGVRRFYAIDASVYLPEYNPEIPMSRPASSSWRTRLTPACWWSRTRPTPVPPSTCWPR